MQPHPYALADAHKKCISGDYPHISWHAAGDNQSYCMIMSCNSQLESTQAACKSAIMIRYHSNLFCVCVWHCVRMRVCGCVRTYVHLFMTRNYNGQTHVLCMINLNCFFLSSYS